jgi:phage protein U
MAIVASFGPVVLGHIGGIIRTYQELTRADTGRWTDHEVHLVKPRSEWCGEALIEISMKVNLNTGWCANVTSIISEFHAMKRNAIPAPLVCGGKPMGPMFSLFVLRSVQETHKFWLGDGTLIGAEIDLGFTEYIPYIEGP